MSCDLSDEEAAALERLLRDTIEADRYPLSHQCDQRGARPATTACGAPSDGLGSQLTRWWREQDSNPRSPRKRDPFKFAQKMQP